jgi:hypothetical protein
MDAVFEMDMMVITEDGHLKTYDHGTETGTQQVVSNDYITNQELVELEEAIDKIWAFRKAQGVK